MILSFTLSMPSNNAWDGRWSGGERLYAKTINFGTGKKSVARAVSIRDGGPYMHNFGDGWVAGITVKEVTATEAAKIRKKSQGFCGYDWMVESIRTYGEIRSKRAEADEAYRSEHDEYRIGH